MTMGGGGVTIRGMELLADLQSLCTLGQRQLMATDYLTARDTLEQAENMAFAGRDWDGLARLYMPLQETRRQIRQRCGEGEVDMGVVVPPGVSPGEFAEDFLATHTHGQYLIAGPGGGGSSPLAFAGAVRTAARDKRLYVETFLAGCYRVGGDSIFVVAPTAHTVLPPGTADSVDALTATPHCLVLPAVELPARAARGDTGTYGLTMSIWERLAAPHLAACLAASAAVPAGQRIKALKRVIEIDPGCEMAHQVISRIAAGAARARPVGG